MANDLTPHKPDAKPVKKVYKKRVSAKAREALHIRVHEGISWAECAERVGLSEAGIHKARRQPHVAALFEEIKAQYIKDVEEMKAPFKATAITVGIDLLHNAKSEAVRARMVEFFAGESKKSDVNVAVSVHNHGQNGYEYAPPGAEIVEIRAKDVTPAPNEANPDAQSVDDGPEGQ